jgi:excisionase family DNA binding protein
LPIKESVGVTVVDLVDGSEAAPRITAPALLEISAALVRLAAAIQAGAEVPAGPAAERERLLTMPEVAERLNVPETYARDLGRAGRLPTVRVGSKYVRVRASELEAWIRERDRASRICGLERLASHEAGNSRSRARRGKP